MSGGLPVRRGGRLDQPLQRFQRDLNTGIGHAVFDEDRTAETHGRVLVGLEPGLTDML